MKLLYISNIAGEHAVSSFSRINLMIAKKMDIEFHLAENFNATPTDVRNNEEVCYGFFTHHIDFFRTPYNPKNITAYKQIVKLIKENEIDAIHCNTPIGGVIGRLAGKKCNVNKVIYQAHGFHFYKGAPIINWLLYYPIERCLAHYTDALITINKEDYDLAQKFHLRNNGKVYYVPGVGIDTNRIIIDEETILRKRKEMGIPKEAIILISVGDLNKNKNNRVILEALKRIDDNNLHYILCGEGPLRKKLEGIAEPIKDRIHFLGYRTDINELLAASDIFVMPSFREGLSRSLMEAMAAGLPCIVSKIRGNVDLINEDNYLCDPRHVQEFATAIEKLKDDYELRAFLGQKNSENVNKYGIDIVKKDIQYIYEEILS